MMTDGCRKAYFDSREFEAEFHCTQALGAFCGENGTTFALWTPTAQAVFVNLYAQGDGGEAFARMALSRGEKGLWSVRHEANLDGTYYDYDVTVDGVTRRTGDPYARACGVNGLRSMVIDLARTNPDGWENDRAPAQREENVIWEIHVKDFSYDPASGVPEAYRGKYKAFTLENTTLGGDGRHETCMAYLRRLGVTHVQLQPVYDYGSVDEAGGENAYNWGYDPVNYNCPEGSYATDPFHGEVRIRELKEAIAALHRNGQRVIMDVVYNHTYNLNAPLFAAAPWYYYRQNEDGSPSNGSGCGNDVACERSMAARYILDSVLYWAQEYHMDGFRFDLMGLMDTGLINRIQRALDERYGKGEKLVYGEPWSAGATAVREGSELAHKDNLHKLDLQVAAFCDNTRDAVKGGLMHRDAHGFVNGGAFDGGWMACCVKGWANVGDAFSLRAPSQTISYLSCHDDWTLWDKLVYTMDDGRRFRRGSEEILRASRLAAAMLFGCQGHVFMLAGEEFGRTKLGVKNSYRTTPQVNRMDWKRAWQMQELVDYYRGLIALRMQLPALCDKSGQASARLLRVSQPQERAVGIELDNAGDSPWSRIILAYNAGEQEAALALEMGAWEVLADGRDTFLWKEPRMVQDRAFIAPLSALILGRR